VTAWDESSPQRPIAGTTKGFIQHQSEHAGSRESTLLAE
jgi:hypothetical protein